MSSCGDVSPPVQVRVNHGAQPVSVGNVEVLDPGSDAVPNARVTFPYRLLAGLDALRSRGGFYGRGIYMAEYARCPPDLCPHPMPFPPPHASARLATSSPPLRANTPACVRACPRHPPIITFTGLPSGTPMATVSAATSRVIRSRGSGSCCWSSPHAAGQSNSVNQRSKGISTPLEVCDLITLSFSCFPHILKCTSHKGSL